MMRRFWSPGLGRYLVVHPSAALALVRAGWLLRRENWWRVSPHLPLPPASYWEFRMTTVGASSHYRPSPTALVEAARWSLEQPVGR